MIQAPLPSNETQRLRALRRRRLLDTPSEQMFDKITARAAEICGTPMAAISLVDEKRQWFKSKVGVEASETPRDITFCAHAILSEEMMVVPDALADERFRDNPLVVEDPHIRFYAGMPLETGDGCALGTLCVMDRTPRELSAEQMAGLRSLAESTKLLFEMKASPFGELFAQAAQGTSDGVTVADAQEPEIPIIYANDAFCRITGYDESEVIGKNFLFLQGPETAPAALEVVRAALRDSETCVVEIVCYRKSGGTFWNRLSLVPLLDEGGKLTYVAALQSDITAVREAQAALHKLDAMVTTMGTVNDIVFNFMTSLQFFRMQMEQCPQADPDMLSEFDAIFADTHAKLSRINTLTSFKSKQAAKGISVLDTE